MKTRVGLAAGLMALLAAGSVVGQETQTERQTDRQSERQTERQTEGRRGGLQSATGESARSVVRPLAGMLAHGNKAEIELGQLALQKSQNDEVKQFAQQMIDDHTAFLGKLKQFNPRIELAAASQQSGQQPRGAQGAQPGNAEQAQPRNAEDAQPGNANAQPRADNPDRERTPGQQARRGQGDDDGQRGGRQSQIMQIHDRACEMKLQMTKEMLSQYEGQDFDMGYLGHQVVAHIEMLAHLKAMQDVGDSEFQQLVTEGAQTTQQHLDHAKMLCKQLEGKEGADTSGATRQRSTNDATERAEERPQP
jgi:predicted outer membrane protein